MHLSEDIVRDLSESLLSTIDCLFCPFLVCHCVANLRESFLMTEDDFDFYQFQMPHEAFHLEVDLYDKGEYYNLLIIPCNDLFIMVSNNEHLTTMAKNGEGVDAWTQLDGQLEDEIFEKLAVAIEAYINSQ